MKISSNRNKRSANTLNILNIYRIILLIILISISNVTVINSYASSPSSSDLEKNISVLEMRFFAHNYSQEPIDKRIDRLEEFVFGMTKSGSEQERITGLLQTVPDVVEDPAKNNEADEQTKTSDSTTDDVSANNAKEDKVSTQSNNADTENNDNSSGESYPAVTTLEQQILGHTYETLPIKKRLNQLEIKAFGRPSESTDLSERVDFLKQYSNSKDIQNDNNLTAEEPSVKWDAHPLGLTQQLGVMEKQVFGKIYSKDKLTSRLHRLEKKVFPKQPPETFAPIAARISRLQVALQPQQPSTNYNTAQTSTNDQSSTPGQIEPFTSSSTNANNSAYQSGAPGSSSYDTLSSNSTNPPPKHHSLLHKIGQVAGVAGSMAIRSMGSGGYGYPGYGYGSSGYGYGSPGYGYSPYGTGSSSMYGYGSSPLGSPMGMGNSYW